MSLYYVQPLSLYVVRIYNRIAKSLKCSKCTQSNSVSKRFFSPLFRFVLSLILVNLSNAKNLTEVRGRVRKLLKFLRRRVSDYNFVFCIPFDMHQITHVELKQGSYRFMFHVQLHLLKKIWGFEILAYVQ